MEEKQLIRETAWSREYRLGPEMLSFESKFVRDGLQVAAATIRASWPRWGLSEQLTFANAFILKPALTSEDQQILQFLIEEGSEPVWATIAYLLPRYHDRSAALAFLLERTSTEGPQDGAYFQALERLGDHQAVPALHRRYEQYRDSLSPFGQHGLHSQLADYQQCCRALWILTRSPEYENALRELLEHPDEGIRRRSQFLLSDR